MKKNYLEFKNNTTFYCEEFKNFFSIICISNNNISNDTTLYRKKK